MADDSDSYEKFDDIFGDEYEVLDDSKDEEKDGEEKDGEEKDGEEKSENAASSQKASRKSTHRFPSKDNPVPCKICNTLFTRADALKSHRAIHRTCICKVCGKAYTSQKRLRAHERSHIEIRRELNVFCKQCNMEFAKKKALDKHVRVMHDVKKLYNCEICGDCYMCPEYLEIHTMSCKKLRTAY